MPHPTAPTAPEPTAPEPVGREPAGREPESVRADEQTVRGARGGGRPPGERSARRAAARTAVWWPVLPAVATVLLLCWPAGHEDITAAVHVTPADVGSAVLVLCCLVAVVRARTRLLTGRAVVVLAAPAVAFAVATATSNDPATSLPGFVRYLQVFVLVPLALVLLLRSRRDFMVVAGGVLAIAVVQGALGVQQYATGTGASYEGQDIRAVGTFGPLDVMGMATVVAHGLIIALALGLPSAADSSRRLRPAALVCASLLLLPLALSFSRGAWLATAVAASAVLVLAGARLALRALVGQRLSSITQVAAAPDRSVTDRYSLWAAARSMWRDEPVTGVGLKGFPAQRDGHASLGLSSGSDTAGAGLEFQREPLLSPHNMYLLILSEQGLIGVTAVFGSWAALLALGLRRLRAARRQGRPADCGLTAVGLLTWTFVDFFYADIGGPSTLLTSIMFGLAGWWALSPAA
ncbi:O-antigen ligase family protein, partial [Streptomyces sp. H27-D2]|uniref:O-antigen ligase family protein n=1 Tax=Streptomyces sp. H27-D2 TaxID=3046304 RepID=UPI002DB6D2AC